MWVRIYSNQRPLRPQKSTLANAPTCYLRQWKNNEYFQPSDKLRCCRDVVGTLSVAAGVVADRGPAIAPEKLAELEAAGYETNPEVFYQLASGGQPMGRWKEGLTFDGVEPMPWLDAMAKECCKLDARIRTGAAQ